MESFFVATESRHTLEGDGMRLEVAGKPRRALGRGAGLIALARDEPLRDGRKRPGAERSTKGHDGHRMPGQGTKGGGCGAKASRTVTVGWVFFATASRHTVLRAEALARDKPLYGRTQASWNRTKDEKHGAFYGVNGRFGRDGVGDRGETATRTGKGTELKPLTLDNT